MGLITVQFLVHLFYCTALVCGTMMVGLTFVAFVIFVVSVMRDFIKHDGWL